MNKVDFKEKIDSMLPELMQTLRKECERLYDCGGVNPDDYENDFRLPKLILSVAIRSKASQYTPLNAQDKRIARNLEYF